jgi:hypothetical protein
MSWRSALLVALGVGAALVSGAGIAQADSSGTGSSPGRSSDSAHAVGQARAVAARTPTKTPRAAVAARPGTIRPTPPTPSGREPAAFAGPAPRPPAQTRPVPDLVAAATKWFGELHDYLTGAPEAQPTPGDATSTPYGDIGKWMLDRTGKLAGWPSPAYPFKNLYQPINVIIIDSTSTTAAESAQKLTAALIAAGFPPQPIHSTGYRGVIDGIAYSQQPTAPEEAFSDANWLLVNDHGRIFGPAPDPAGTGFVWTASFSREQPGLSYLTPTHIYASFNKARDAVRAALVGSGATDLGEVDLDNTLTGRTVTTGDHDGYAVVLELS